MNSESQKNTKSIDLPDSDFDKNIERCLSMVFHHEEVQQIAAIIKKIHSDRAREKGGQV